MLTGFQNLFDSRAVSFRRRQADLEHLAIAGDDGEQIVEVVRDATRQHTQRFHLLRLAQLFFEVSTRGGILQRQQKHLAIRFALAFDLRQPADDQVYFTKAPADFTDMGVLNLRVDRILQ